MTNEAQEMGDTSKIILETKKERILNLGIIKIKIKDAGPAKGDALRRNGFGLESCTGCGLCDVECPSVKKLMEGKQKQQEESGREKEVNSMAQEQGF